MGISEMKVVEEKCDRCQLLISTKRVDSDGKSVSEKKQAENRGAFVVNVNGNSVVKYEVVCERCIKRLDALVKEMGTVNRGRRGRKSKKDKSEDAVMAIIKNKKVTKVKVEKVKK